nr:MMPL family transporter [Actinomadura sp. HBU206391]
MSEDGQVAYLAFTFNFGENGWLDIPDAADEVRDITAIDGVIVHLAGYGGQAVDAFEASEGIDTNLIMITLLVVVVILLLTYRSPVLWLLPIISAVFAYMISGGVVYLLAKNADLTVNGRASPSSASWSSAPAPTTRCCLSRDIAKSSVATRTGMRPWRSHCIAPLRPSWPAPRPS